MFKSISNIWFKIIDVKLFDVLKWHACHHENTKINYIIYNSLSWRCWEDIQLQQSDSSAWGNMRKIK